MAMVPGAVVAQTRALEHAVKVSYLFKFSPFIEWPERSFESAADPLVLCVVGNDAVADLVDDAARTAGASGRPLVVKHLPASGVRDAKCHVMYLAQGENAARVLDQVRGTPALTITDFAPDARLKGIVNFVVVDNRVRFEIDLQAAAENGISVSSKLLDLAIRVRPKAPG
jgi:hypothetical protein